MDIPGKLERPFGGVLVQAEVPIRNPQQAPPRGHAPSSQGWESARFIS